jgi:hypothetical protein
MRLVTGTQTISLALKISFALVAALFMLAACSSAKSPVAEAPPAVSPTPSEQAQLAQNNLPAPDLNNVQVAVKRVFKDAARIDTSRSPSFIAGDFNGDQSQDIAVVVKPDPEKLSALNEEFPAWILRDPFGPTESKSPRLRVAADDVLLAIIHGYGANGWRDPEATQTYLLKNASGLNMESQPLSRFVAQNEGKKLPRLRGDVVGQILQGKQGYLYYAGATYSWYDPKTFTGEPVPRRGHGDQAMKR